MARSVGTPSRVGLNPWTGARGYVWRHRSGAWLAMVVDSHGIVINVDDADCWGSLMRAMHQKVGAVRLVEGMGHRLRPWADLLEEEGDGF